MDGKAIGGEELIRSRVRAFVRERPLVAVGAAAAVGATFGGVFFSRLGRLVFVAAAGYVLNELWHHGGQLELRGAVERLTKESR